MRAILVHVDALDVLAIDVAAQVEPLVYDEAPLALLMGKMSERGSIETGANDETIVLFYHIYTIFLIIGIRFKSITANIQLTYITMKVTIMLSFKKST